MWNKIKPILITILTLGLNYLIKWVITKFDTNKDGKLDQDEISSGIEDSIKHIKPKK